MHSIYRQLKTVMLLAARSGAVLFGLLGQGLIASEGEHGGDGGHAHGTNNVTHALVRGDHRFTFHHDMPPSYVCHEMMNHPENVVVVQEGSTALLSQLELQDGQSLWVKGRLILDTANLDAVQLHAIGIEGEATAITDAAISLNVLNLEV